MRFSLRVDLLKNIETMDGKYNLLHILAIILCVKFVYINDQTVKFKRFLNEQHSSQCYIADTHTQTHIATTAQNSEREN